MALEILPFSSEKKDGSELICLHGSMLDREEYNLNGKKREREGYSSQPQLDDDAARGVREERGK